MGHVLDEFHVAAAARNNGPQEPFSFLTVCQAARQLLPGDAFELPGLRVTPIAVLFPRGNGRGSVTFKVHQLSLACPVKRAQPPWTVDDTALIPSLTTSQLTTGRSGRTESATYAAPIVRTMPSMIPKNMRIQAPFCPERFLKTRSGSPKTRTHTSFCFHFRSTPPRHFRARSQD